MLHLLLWLVSYSLFVIEVDLSVCLICMLQGMTTIVWVSILAAQLVIRRKCNMMEKLPSFICSMQWDFAIESITENNAQTTSDHGYQ